VAGAEIEIEAVKLLQFLDALARRLLERRSAVKSVQHDAFEQVAEGQIVKFGQGFEHLEEALLDAHSRLDSFNHKAFVIFLCSHDGTNVPRYIQQAQLIHEASKGLADAKPAMRCIRRKFVQQLRPSALPSYLFLTRASGARSIVRECNREGPIRNHRERFRKVHCCTVTLCGALLLTSPVMERARAASPQAAAQKTPEAKFQLTSSSFAADSDIPAKYTCDGANVSPALAWNEPPAGTQSFALVVDDPDVPAKTVIHWLIYDLPPATHTLPEGVPTKTKLPDDSRQGKNVGGKIGYTGPCPQQGGAAHHYFFKLYALDYKTGLKPKATAAEVEKAIKGHILAQAELIARFQH
jgi:Raf kinase inhibitor-like YbhB/YbcL family protein